MIFEVVLVIIIVAGLLMVSPGILSAIQTSAPQVNSSLNPELAVSQNVISGITAGGLNVSGIVLFALAIGLITSAVLLRGDYGNL